MGEKGNGSYLNNQRMRVSARSKLENCTVFFSREDQNMDSKDTHTLSLEGISKKISSKVSYSY